MEVEDIITTVIVSILSGVLLYQERRNGDKIKQTKK